MKMLLACIAAVFALVACGQAKCQKCMGTGTVYEYVVCPTCNGSQKIHRTHVCRDGYHTYCCWAKCQTCTGLDAGNRRGYVRQKVECPKCNGLGKTDEVQKSRKQVIRMSRASLRRLVESGCVENDKLKIILEDE